MKEAAWLVQQLPSVLLSWRWAKVCPKHVELILEINKTVIVASRYFLYYLTYIDDTRSNTNQMYICLRVMHPIVFSDFKLNWIFSADFFLNYPNIKYHENLSSGSRVALCGRQVGRHVDGRIDWTKPIAAFRNFVKAPENSYICRELALWYFQGSLT